MWGYSAVGGGPIKIRTMVSFNGSDACMGLPHKYLKLNGSCSLGSNLGGMHAR